MQKNRAGKDVSDGSFQKNCLFSFSRGQKINIYNIDANLRRNVCYSLIIFCRTIIAIRWSVDLANFSQNEARWLSGSNLAGFSRIAVLLLGFLKGDIMIDAVTPYGEDWARTILGSLRCVCVGHNSHSVSLSPPMSVNCYQQTLRETLRILMGGGGKGRCLLGISLAFLRAVET